MMTIDEAIQHCLDNADKECREGKCSCSQEHRQLAEWLIELKRLKEADYNG